MSVRATFGVGLTGVLGKIRMHSERAVDWSRLTLQMRSDARLAAVKDISQARGNDS